jgi:O-antigen/teichoic acid export membrane protein
VPVLSGNHPRTSGGRLNGQTADAEVEFGTLDRQTADLRGIFDNAAALLGAYLLPRSLTFLSALVAARTLGPEGFGAYSTAASFAMVTSVFATLGMQPLLIRDMARRPHESRGLIVSAHLVKALSSLLMLGAVWFLCRFIFRYSTEVTAAALILACGYVFIGFSENLNAWFQAHERMVVWLQASVLFGLINGLLGVVLLLTTRSALAYCATFAAGQLSCLLWLYYRLPHSTVPVIKKRRVIPLIREALPFAAGFLALTLYYKLDVLLLQRLQPLHVVGQYAAAYKFVDIIQALTVVACGALYPRLSRVASPDRRNRSSQRILEVGLLAIVPASALLWILRGLIVTTLFGPSYAESVQVMDLLSPAVVLLVLNTVGWYLLSAANRPGSLAICYVVATMIKVGLGLVLIPQFGALGAAISMAATELFLAAAMLVVLMGAQAGSIGSRTAMLAAAGATAAFGLGSVIVSPVVAAAAYTTFAALLYWFGGAVRPAEWHAIGTAFGMNRAL